MNAMRFSCCALVLILSNFSRSMWIAVSIRTGIFLTESLRHISNVTYVGWTFLRRMIREWYPWPEACCTEDPEKKLSQSPIGQLIGTTGVFRPWTADIFSKRNIHFLEVVSIKSTCEFKHIIEWVLLETFYKSILSSGPDASHLRDFSGR